MSTKSEESDPLMRMWISLGNDILEMSPEQLDMEFGKNYDDLRADGEYCREIGLQVLADWRSPGKTIVTVVNQTPAARLSFLSIRSRVILERLLARFLGAGKAPNLNGERRTLFLLWINRKTSVRTAVIPGIAIIVAILCGTIFITNKINEKRIAEAANLVDEGVELFNKKDYDGAIALYKKAIDIDKNQFVAYNNLGYTLMVMGRIDDALVDLTRSIEINGGYARAWANRGILYSDEKKFPQAISDLTMALYFVPNDASLLNDRGLAYYGDGQSDLGRRKKDYELAMKDYDASIKLSPSFPWPYNNRGNIYLVQGVLDRAIEEYSKAIDITPFAMAYKNRAIAYVLGKKLDKAIEDFGRALKLVPTFADALNGRGVAEMERGNLELALVNFNQAIQLSPDQSGFYANRSLLWALMNNTEKAVSDLDKALELDPHNQALIELKKMIHNKEVLSASFLCDSQVDVLKAQNVACGGGKIL